MKKTIEQLADEDKLCNYCDWAIGGNNNQYNLCEGGNCENAYKEYLESEDDLKEDNNEI